MAGLSGSNSRVSWMLLKSPRTQVTIMCRTQNQAAVCPGSNTQVAMCQFLLDQHLQRVAVLQAGQHLTADHEHRHSGDACLFVGVPERLLMSMSIFPGSQGLLEV